MFTAFYFFILIVTCLVGPGIYFQKNIPGYLKFFPPFFLISLIDEFCEYWAAVKYNNNLFIYNFFWVFEICFFLFVIRQIVENVLAKKMIFLAGVIYPVLAVFSIVFITGLNVTPTVTLSFGAILIIISCCYYFFQLLRAPKVRRVWKEPAFWICAGLLFFYTCILPLVVANNVLGNQMQPVSDPKYDSIIIFIIRLYVSIQSIFYSTLIIACLCKIENL